MTTKEDLLARLIGRDDYFIKLELNVETDDINTIVLNSRVANALYRYYVSHGTTKRMLITEPKPIHYIRSYTKHLTILCPENEFMMAVSPFTKSERERFLKDFLK